MSSSTDKKVRVYEIAKDLKMSSDAVVEMLRALDISVRSHMSTVDAGAIDLLRDKMQKEKQVVKEDLARKQQLAIAKAQAPPAEPPAVVQQPAASAVAAGPPAVTSPPAATTAPPKPASPPSVRPPAPTRSPARPATSSSRSAGPATRSAPPRTTTGPYRPGGPPSRPSGPPTRTFSPSRPSPAGGQRGSGGEAFPPMPPGAGRAPGRGGRPGRTGPAGKKDRKKKRRTVDERAVEESVRRTLASMESGRTRRRRRDRGDGEAEGAPLLEKKLLSVPEFITVGELAERMGEKPQEVLAACLQLGLMVNINRRLGRDAIALVADEFQFDVDFSSDYGEETLELPKPEASELVARPPVITVMGHVDHGKTSLLDYIRKTNVIAGEAGGITQHIGAYQVDYEGRKLTFLDTPGHEAFTSMRARGAHVTDIVVLVVAADDRVMPQTVEAIDHAKAANVPIVVAINKIDLPAANVDLVRQELTRHNVIVEEFGGQVPAVPISAKKGTNVDKLLEILLLQADLLELTAESKRAARGVIVESKLDKGRGILADVLIQSGELKIGQAFVAGQAWGRVRAMQNERGQAVKDVGPSTPVEVLGWQQQPQAGDTFAVVAEERDARELASKRQQLARAHDQPRRHLTLDDLHTRIQEGTVTLLPLIVKGDVDGSIEALIDALGRLSTDEVKLRILHSGVGAINVTDVDLAAASDAIILGFHVRPEPNARERANREGVDVRLYNIIYEAVEEVKSAMSGLLKPEIKQTIIGSAEIRRVFEITKSGTVAGCMVVAGQILRNARVRVIRNQDVIWEGAIESLKHIKDDVREIKAGFECGIKLAGFDQIREGDLIEAYTVQEVARTVA